jgi:hypothetical protein
LRGQVLGFLKMIEIPMNLRRREDLVDLRQKRLYFDGKLRMRLRGLYEMKQLLADKLVQGIL